jgi:hypothetical protein
VIWRRISFGRSNKLRPGLEMRVDILGVVVSGLTLDSGMGSEGNALS